MEARAPSKFDAGAQQRCPQFAAGQFCNIHALHRQVELEAWFDVAGQYFLDGRRRRVLAPGRTHANGKPEFVKHAFRLQLRQLLKRDECGPPHFFAFWLTDATHDLEFAQ